MKNGKNPRRMNKMNKMLIITVLATAFTISYTKDAEACSPVISLGEAGCKDKCNRDCPTADMRAFCQSGCIGGPKDPCADQPGTKWCKALRKCVPVADYATVCREEEPPPVDPCDDERVQLFSCVSWCPSLNGGKGGFIPAADAAVCPECEFGDNGIRCLAEGEGECPDCVTGAGGVDLTWVYVLLGLLTVLVIVGLIRQGGPKGPTECPKCKKVAVIDGTCLSCGHKVVDPPAPPASAGTPTVPLDTSPPAAK